MIELLARSVRPHSWRVCRQASKPFSAQKYLPLLRASHLHNGFGSNSKSSNSRDSATVIFSGIQPTGVPHLGNYLGAILPWVELQNKSPPSTSLFYSIVDLHSLTSHQPASDRITSRRHLLASFLAAGLDPLRCTLFFQSAVPAHAELHWILSCTASMSVLARMTQWKAKLSDQGVAELLSQSPNPKNVERLKLGLFSYPVLQAADILLHRATHVPVGDDQRQHVEFARTCAQTFNHTYAKGEELLVAPEVVVSEAKRVMSLTEPEKKMSKSHENERSRVVLTDSDDEIRKKFRTALTDSLPGISYDREARPGVSNLLEIVAHLSDRTCEETVAEFGDSSLKLLKTRAADLVIDRFAPMRERFQQLVGEHNGRSLDDIAIAGAEKANASAQITMQKVKSAVGL